MAEQTLADARWSEREIGQGVVWRHYQFEELYGQRQSITVIEADLDTTGVQVSFPYLARERGLISSFVPQQVPTAVAAINGTYFDTTVGGGGAVTYLRVNNTDITPPSDKFGAMGTEAAVTASQTGKIDITPRPKAGWTAGSSEIRDALANGPILLAGGLRPDFTPYGAHCASRHPRSAVGMTADNRLVFVTIDGRTDQSAGMSCDEVARLMEELGCVTAFNLDGGGSSTMWVKGEPHDGIVNYPSDNGEYDHKGERQSSNAIAVSALPPGREPWEARLTEVSYSPAMTAGTTQVVTLEYENLGTETWTRDSTALVLTRPAGRTSDFYTTGSWASPSRPALLDPGRVGPGEKGRFSFVLTAPRMDSGRYLLEDFGLEQKGIGAFGPADNAARLKILAYPPEEPSTGTVIIESRQGGQNWTRYSDTGGWVDAGIDCRAPGATEGIGQRYGSTFRTKAGTKVATYRPNFANRGEYRVYVAFGDGGRLARSGVTCKVTDAKGTTSYSVDQTQNANEWVLLGTHTFDAGQEGHVILSNEELNVSGNMYAGAVKFEPVDGGGR